MANRGASGYIMGLLFAVAAPGMAGVLGEASGTGPSPAVAELVDSLPTHTIYRPATLPKTALPLFVWGNGACRDNGLQHGAFLRQIASQGYFVVALGRPREERPFNPAPPPEPAAAAPGQPPPRNTPDETQSAQMLEAIDWATRENARAGSAFQGHIDVAHIAVGGHSCGGLQALAVSGDPRINTTLVLNSGIYVQRSGGRSGVQIDKSQLTKLHGPMLYLTGGTGDIAHPNSSDDVARINHVPVFMGSLPVGHGGTFWTQRDGGDWARVATRWLNYTLKADADASWDFAGPACRLCADKRWTVVQKQMPLPKGPYRESLYVAVRDGTRLAMNVYIPAVDGRPVNSPHPVIFSFTPYRARYHNAGQVVELAQFTGIGLKDLTDRGYVLAVADIRGKGASFGARRGFQDRTEANDGHDLVQWLAAQPWGNGRVGMLGCSYMGGTTVHVASTAPPALKAIFTGATDLDKYAFVRGGGITAQFNTRPDEPLSDDLMSLPMDTDVDGAQLRAAVAEHARNTPMAALWYGMPYRDSVSNLTGNRFWEEAGPYPYLDVIRKAGIATYFWGNWQDEPTEQVILLYANLGGRLLIGPGSHCVPPPGYDLGGEITRYFDYHLKDADSGLHREPKVTYFVNGANEGRQWIHGDQPPGTGVARTTFLLSGPGGEGAGHTDGGLSKSAARSTSTTFAVDYDVASDEYFAFWVDSQQAHGLRFTGKALEADTTMVGSPVMDLQIAADRPEANVFAYLEDLAPDGKAVVVSLGRLAASYRRLTAAPYETLGLPWHSGMAADNEPMKPGKPAQLKFALTPSAWVFKAGHRMRVVVTGADPRQRNLLQIRQDPPPRLTVLSGGARGSRIELPLIQ